MAKTSKSHSTQKFLIEILNAAGSNEVKIELSTPVKAGIIKPIEEDETKN